MSLFRRIVLDKYVLLGVISLILLYTILFSGNARPIRTGWPSAHSSSKFVPNASRPACYGLPGSDDVVVVMKTGSTELRDKLPVHLETTMRCYTDYLIFSDVEETFEGELILDALESVDAKVRAEHEDFALWRRLQKSGRAALKNSELSGPINPPRGGGGKDNNPGWKIDKWKFLPMLNRTLQEYPGKKWFVFVETDTFLFWHTLLEYLGRLDWQVNHYMGAQINIGDIEFAHGGAGFVASRPAMQQVVSMFNNHQKEWEDFTDGHWAGDCVLGKAFKDSGTRLLGAFPIFQGDPVGNMNYATNNMWCGPSASYHHSSPAVVRDLFAFQEESIMKSLASKHKPGYVSHKDVFASYVLPRTTKPRTNWDNHSDEDQGPVDSLEACHAICESLPSCVQYSVNTGMRCSTTARPNAGDATRGVDSGWIHSRMEAFFNNVEKCQNDGIWHDY